MRSRGAKSLARQPRFPISPTSWVCGLFRRGDGQPLNPPFPKSLALWHRHENICVLPHLGTLHALSESQCREQGGHFIAKTQWLVHAWIWKENPAGIFSAENPALR